MPLLQGLHVVAVDDHDDSLEMLLFILEGCGARVTTATNATDALERVVAESPDVLVSDISMPGRDGFWLMREVRALGLQVPAVAVTGVAASQPTLTAGYKAFLKKPIDPEALCRVVAEVAGKRA